MKKGQVLLLLSAVVGLTVSTGSRLLDLERRFARLSLESEDLKILLPRGKIKGKSVANRLSVHGRRINEDVVAKEAARRLPVITPSTHANQATSDVLGEETAQRLTTAVLAKKGDTQQSHSSSSSASSDSRTSGISRGSSVAGAQDLLSSYLTQQRSSAFGSLSSPQQPVSQTPRNAREGSSGKVSRLNGPSGQSARPTQRQLNYGTLDEAAFGFPPRYPTGPSSRLPVQMAEARQREILSQHRRMPNRASSNFPQSQASANTGQGGHLIRNRYGQLLQFPPGPIYLPQQSTSVWPGSGYAAGGLTLANPYTTGVDRAHIVPGHVMPVGIHYAQPVFPQGQPYNPLQVPPYVPQRVPMSTYAEYTRRPRYRVPWEDLTHTQQVAADPANTQRLLSVVTGASDRNVVQHEARRTQQEQLQMGWGGGQLRQRSPPRTNSPSGIPAFWSDSMKLGHGGFPNLLDPNRPRGSTGGDHSTGSNPRLSPRDSIHSRDLGGMAEQQIGFSSLLSTRAATAKVGKTTAPTSSHLPSEGGQRGEQLLLNTAEKPLQGGELLSSKRTPMGGPSGKTRHPRLSLAERLRIVGGPSRVASKQQEDAPSQRKEQSSNFVKDGDSAFGSTLSLSGSQQGSANALPLEKSKHPSTPHPMLPSLPARIEGSVSPRPE